MVSTVPHTPSPPLRVRFRYLLGEWLAGEWRPLLVPLEQASTACALCTTSTPSTPTAPWPQLAQLPPATSLPADVAGYQVRRTAVERFPRGVSRQGDWLCYSPREDRLYFVNLTGTFGAYLQRRSPKSRQNLKRTVRRFMEDQAGTLDIATAPQAMAGFHKEAVAISRHTYQERMLNAGLPATAEFLQAMEKAAERGDARGYLLRNGQGQAIAFAWCSARGNTLVYEVIGYLPQHAEQSPGTVLLYLILQDLFALERHRLLDFGSGSAFYKEAFATGCLEFADCYLLRPTAGHRVRVWLHWGMERFSAAVGAWLDRMGLKKKIRMLMRGGAGG